MNTLGANDPIDNGVINNIIMRVIDLETSDNFQAYYNFNKGASRQNSLTDAIVTLAFRVVVTTPGTAYYHTIGPVAFPDISFSEKPVVVVTGDDASGVWVVPRVSSVTTTGFHLGLLNPGQPGPVNLLSTVGVNVVAVGPVEKEF